MKRSILIIVFSIFSSSYLLSQDAPSRESDIVKILQSNNVYQLLSIPVNDIFELDAVFLNALLTTNGLNACKIYRQIAIGYPKSGYAPLCQKRLNDYTLTMDLKPLSSSSTTTPQTKTPLNPNTEKTNVNKGSVSSTTKYIIQFGVFSSKASAENIARLLSERGIETSTSVLSSPSKTLYKVLSSTIFSSEDEAKAVAQKGKVDFFISKIK